MKQEQVQRMKARIHNRAYTSVKTVNIEGIFSLLLVLFFIYGLTKCVPSQPVSISPTDKLVIDMKGEGK